MDAIGPETDLTLEKTWKNVISLIVSNQWTRPDPKYKIAQRRDLPSPLGAPPILKCV